MEDTRKDQISFYPRTMNKLTEESILESFIPLISWVSANFFNKYLFTCC